MTRALLDKLDRIVIPKDICRALRLSPGSPILFSIENGRVVITPEEMVCAVCGERIDKQNNMRLCKVCIEKAKEVC